MPCLFNQTGMQSSNGYIKYKSDGKYKKIYDVLDPFELQKVCLRFRMGYGKLDSPVLFALYLTLRRVAIHRRRPRVCVSLSSNDAFTSKH